jgi:hypothetical protein
MFNLRYGILPYEEQGTGDGPCLWQTGLVDRLKLANGIFAGRLDGEQGMVGCGNQAV